MYHLIISLLILALSSMVQAEGPGSLSHTGPWKTQRKESVTVSGKVLRTDRFSESEGEEVGAKIQLETGKGILHVHVGPMWFTSVGTSAPKIGEPMTVVGVRFSFDKKPALEAHEVIINGKKFTVWEKTDSSKKERALSND